MLDHTARGWEWKTPPSYSLPTSVTTWVPNPTLKISCDKNGDIIVEPVKDIVPKTSYEFEYRINDICSSKGKVEFDNMANINLTKKIFSSLRKRDFIEIMQSGLTTTHTRGQKVYSGKFGRRSPKIPPRNIFNDPPRINPNPPQLSVWFNVNNTKIVIDKSYQKVVGNYLFTINPTKGQFIRKDKREVLYEISSEISLGSKKENVSMQFSKYRFNSRFAVGVGPRDGRRNFINYYNIKRKVMYRYTDDSKLIPDMRNSFDSDGRWITTQPSKVVIDYANKGPGGSKLELYFGSKPKIIDLPDPNDSNFSGGSNDFSWKAQAVCDGINSIGEINLIKKNKLSFQDVRQGTYYYNIKDKFLVVEKLDRYYWENYVDWNLDRLKAKFVLHDLKNGKSTDYQKVWNTPSDKKNQWIMNIVSVFLHDDIWRDELENLGSEYDYDLKWEEEFFIGPLKGFLDEINFDDELSLELNLPDNWAFRHTKSYDITSTDKKIRRNEEQSLEIEDLFIEKNWLVPVSPQKKLLPPILLDLDCFPISVRKAIPVYMAGPGFHQIIFNVDHGNKGWNWNDSSWNREMGNKFKGGYIISIRTIQGDPCRRLMVSVQSKGKEKRDISKVLGV